MLDFGQAFLAVGALNGKLVENLRKIGGKLVDKVLTTTVRVPFQHAKLLAVTKSMPPTYMRIALLR